MAAAFSRARRQRLANALFVVASAQVPVPELFGVADELRVQFPWGSLLGAILDADREVAANLASLLAPHGRLIVSLSITERDRLERVPRLDDTTAARIGREVASASGMLRLTGANPITRSQTAAMHSTWAKRLDVGRSRPGWTLTFERTA